MLALKNDTTPTNLKLVNRKSKLKTKGKRGNYTLIRKARLKGLEKARKARWAKKEPRTDIDSELRNLAAPRSRKPSLAEVQKALRILERANLI